MNNVAQTRTTRFELTAVSSAWALPGVLAVNTVALLTLEQLGGVPSWVKAAVALFLAF
jgi:hypothetical protein